MRREQEVLARAELVLLNAVRVHEGHGRHAADGRARHRARYTVAILEVCAVVDARARVGPELFVHELYDLLVEGLALRQHVERHTMSVRRAIKQRNGILKPRVRDQIAQLEVERVLCVIGGSITILLDIGQLGNVV
jgi:hypothetical protein